MKIRKMKPADIPSVVAIESEAYNNPISESDLHKEIRNKSNGSEHPSFAPIAACKEDGTVIGYSLLGRDTEDRSSLRILVISTAKDERRKGVAIKLINHIKTKMKEMRCRSIKARVHQDRIPAMNLLAKSGFTCTGFDEIENGEDKQEVYNFSYSVPMDDLSNRHIAKIARECKEARLSRQQEED